MVLLEPGWGQWGIDLDHASPEPYFQLASRLGIRSVALGSGAVGKGVDGYIHLLREDETSRRNRTRIAELALRFGFLFPGVGWDTRKDLEHKKVQLNSLYDAGSPRNSF